MKRSKHSLSHYVLSTFDMGQLVPVANFEVLPGDSVRMSTSCLLRVSPLLSPVMHPVQVRLHHFFVPYRILWTGWEDFITGGSDGLGDGVGALPAFTAGNFSAGSVADYMGLPTGVNLSANAPVSKLPMRAYAKIWNEFYRDQDLETEAVLTTDADILTLRSCSWEKDYFTSARPWTQKGPNVVVPLGQTAPVKTSTANQVTGAQTPVRWLDSTGAQPPGPVAVGSFNNAGNQEIQATNTAVTSQGSGWYPKNLYADLAAATGASINQLREAFALQRYQEARAQYGSRYTEYLRYLGVRSSDARLQRPEYLGGGRATIAFSEVLRTGDQGASTRIGELQGHGISALRTRRWIRFFEEHGVVVTLASIRPKTLYPDGLFRKWSRQVKEDFWQRELEQIGQQEVFNREVRLAHATPGGIFGYQDRYAEYRHEPSYVTADFRGAGMNDWHLARLFASDPALNASFVSCAPSKRIHAVQTDDVIWGMFSHSIQARRMVGNRVIGRLF